MNLFDINKKYIDDSLRYYICEIYCMNRPDQISYPTAIDRMKNMLAKRLDRLIEMNFIVDFKIEVVLMEPGAKRDSKISSLLDGAEYREEHIEALYQMTNRSMHSVKIARRELDEYEQRATHQRFR